MRTRPDLLHRLSRRLLRFWDSQVLRIPPRSPDPYATHIPVLMLSTQLRTVRRVLEFGCGRYSTLLFLNQQCFPHLEVLDSWENDHMWAQQVEAEAGSDSRLRVHVSSGPIADEAKHVLCEDYDLIFIDDSSTASARCDTIRVVGLKCPKHPLVIVHDFEMPEFRAASAGFKQRFRFTALNPNTGVLWNSNEYLRSRLSRLNRALRDRGGSFRENDISSWLRFFGERLREEHS